MELFTGHGPGVNLLPFDGSAYYYRNFLSSDLADRYFRDLLDGIEWKHDEVVMFGKKITTKRAVAWYGDKPFVYTYSKVSKTALPFTPVLSDIKLKAEKLLGTTFNSCLLNLYHNGMEGMAWHSDNEKELQENGIIASVSLGAERKFQFRHKASNLTVPVRLQNGSLLTMLGAIQQHWLHQLPVARSITEPRINLTFRTIVS